MADIPKTMRAFVLEKGEGKPGVVYHPASVKEIPTPERVSYWSKCWRALSITGIYSSEGVYSEFRYFKIRSLIGESPGIVFSSVMGSDGVGEVVAPSSHPLHGKLVLTGASLGWDEDPVAPESKSGVGIFGSVKPTQGRGTFAGYMAIEADRCVPCPEHLSKGDEILKAAAISLGSVTAYRATFSKGQVASGQNVLITGIGGGVALQALQFAVAAGANVFVTSGSSDKIDKAVELGAKGGVSYKEDKWEKKLTELLPKDRPYLDCVIDSAGGDIASRLARILKEGGIVVSYGSTTGKDHTISMLNILRNHDFKGSTMGSNREWKEAAAFIEKHRIVPVVHTVLNGLDGLEEGFQIMDKGTQFGKIVADFRQESKKRSNSKL